MRRPLSTLIVALAASASILVGCEQAKVDQAAYDQIKIGMSYEEVKSILGGDGVDETPSGTSISGGGVASGSASAEKFYVWKDKSRTIGVNIKDGKVVNMTKSGF